MSDNSRGVNALRERLLFSGGITPDEYVKLDEYAFSEFATPAWRERETAKAAARKRAHDELTAFQRAQVPNTNAIAAALKELLEVTAPR